jgi:hypothetical protein
MDPDAAAYITAVETADTEPLEEKTKIAIDNFVLGCKSDGIWNAIKASCILAGARTLTGALVPLVGPAPTNNNFASGDYNRKTGLVGDGSTKYLNSNRNNNADPQDSQHMAVYVRALPSFDDRRSLIGCGVGNSGSSQINSLSNGNVETRSRSSATFNSGIATATKTIGISRSSSVDYLLYVAGATATSTTTSETPLNQSITVFARGGGTSSFSDARLGFYSIGESLDLALLDARVTDLINAFGAAIP